MAGLSPARKPGSEPVSRDLALRTKVTCYGNRYPAGKTSRSAATGPGNSAAQRRGRGNAEERGGADRAVYRHHGREPEGRIRHGPATGANIPRPGQRQNLMHARRVWRLRVILAFDPGVVPAPALDAVRLHPMAALAMTFRGLDR